MEEERRRHVIRQVSHHAQRRRQGGEIEAQGIALDEPQPLLGKTLPQAGGEITVELDGREMAGSIDERLGERAESGADLDQMLAGFRVDGGDDAPDDIGIAQEILSEALALPVALYFGAHVPLSPWAARRSSTEASRQASVTASKRLPGSARPVPARSSAVP